MEVRVRLLAEELLGLVRLRELAVVVGAEGMVAPPHCFVFVAVGLDPFVYSAHYSLWRPVG